MGVFKPVGGYIRGGIGAVCVEVGDDGGAEGEPEATEEAEDGCWEGVS